MKKEINLKNYIFILFVLFSLFFLALGFQAIAVTDDYWLAAYVLKKSKLFFTSFDWANRQFFTWSGQYILNFLQALFTFKPLNTNLTSGFHGLLFLGMTLFWIQDSYKKWETEREARTIFGMTILLCILTFTYNVLGESIFMAASGYAWSYCFFILGYLILRSNLFSKYVWMRYIIFFALGNSSEFLIFPTLAMFWLTRKEEITSRKKIVASYLLGLIIYIFAPGTFLHLRLGLASISLSPMDQLYHVEVVLSNAFSFLGFKFLFAIPLMMCCQVSSLINLSDLQEKMKESFILSILSIFILIPVIGSAAGGTFFFFLIFFSLTVFWSIQYLKRRFLQYRFSLNVQHSVLLIYLLTGIWFVFVNFFNAVEVRQSFINQHNSIEFLANTSKKINFPNHIAPVENHILYYADYTQDPQDINNLARAEYYELESIVAK